MVTIQVSEGNSYSVDGYLASNISLGVKRIKKKWDNLWLIDGDEGVGKSTMGKAVGYFAASELNKDFCVENIFFDINEMEKYALNNRNKIIIWDEAALGGLAEDWQDDFQKTLVKILITCRKYGHFFIFILPDFSSLRRYIAVKRSIALIRCYTPDRMSRGFFKFYGKNKKAELYRLEKEFKDSNCIIPSFFGKYYDVTGQLIDEEEYERKKDEAIQSLMESKKDKRDLKWKDRCMKLIHLLKVKEKYSIMKIGKELGVAQQNLNSEYNKFLNESGIVIN
jgi:hypothetical protein